MWTDAALLELLLRCPVLLRVRSDLLADVEWHPVGKADRVSLPSEDSGDAMHLGRHILLILVLLPMGLRAQTVQGVAPSDTSVAITVDVPLGDWLERYRQWASRDRGASQGEATPPRTQQPVMLGMPYLEYFSPTGTSLYRGSTAEANAAFILDLQEHGAKQGKALTPDPSRPSLLEYFDLAPQLKQYERKVMSKNRFVLLSIVFPDKPFCKAQSDAIRQLRDQPNVQIIEIHLHS